MFTRRILQIPLGQLGRVGAVPLAARLPSAVATTNLSPVARNFSSIKDMFTNYASSKMQQSQENQFGKMIDAMAEANSWTFRNWKGLLEQQLSSWMMYIPGVSGSKDAESLKEFKAMLDALTPEELDDPDLVNGEARERIAKTTGKPIETVRNMVQLYNQTKFYHLSLKMLKSKNEPLPKTPKEMAKMMEQDPRLRPIYMECFPPRRSGKSRRR